MSLAGARSVALRVATMGAKLLLILGLARYLPAADVGLYAVFVATVAIAMVLVGMDFYTFSTRELAAADPALHARMLRDQATFHLRAYALVLPPLALVFALGVLPWALAPWFVAILLAEHASQELTRALIAKSRPVAANVLLFVRSGAWVLAVLALFELVPRMRTLEAVWTGWLLGALLSLALAARMLRGMGWRAAFTAPIDRAWVREGARVGLRLLISTLATLGLVTLDRYALKLTWGAAEAGVYAFFFSVTNFVQTFGETGVVQVGFPRVVAAFSRGDLREYRELMGSMATRLALSLAFAALVTALVVEAALRWVVLRPEYAAARPVFYVLLAAAAALTLALIPHYALYARGDDRALVRSALVGLAVAGALFAALIPPLGALGAAVGSLGGSLAVLIAKAAHNRLASPAEPGANPVAMLDSP